MLWTPGGLPDILMRTIAPSMENALGQPVVIENPAGANGAVGTLAVARASADGHTPIFGYAETHCVNPLIYPKLAYSRGTRIHPGDGLRQGPLRADHPAEPGCRYAGRFLALARRDPGKFTYASWGIGSTSHLAMEALIRQAGLSMLHVPFPSAAPATTPMVSGQVDVMFLNAGPAEATARNGKMRILGVGAAGRILQLPAMPTLAELGMPIEAANWFGLLGPACLPDDVASPARRPSPPRPWPRRRCRRCSACRRRCR